MYENWSHTNTHTHTHTHTHRSKVNSDLPKLYISEAFRDDLIVACVDLQERGSHNHSNEGSFVCKTNLNRKRQ